MKRYRICSFDFDSRASMLSQEIKESWAPDVKEQWKKNKELIKTSLVQKFGVDDFARKIDRFKSLGNKPISIISNHNRLLDDIRNAYVFGSYYSALTGVSALGERILNHLVLDLRDEYKASESKMSFLERLKQLFSRKPSVDIHTTASFSSWTLMIKTLQSWGVISDEVAKLFKKMAKIRHKSLHFNISTVVNLDKDALAAILTLQEIIQKLFPAMGSPDYFIPAKGEAYLKKELESKPFFRKYYLPNSVLVSPYHKVISGVPHFRIEDRKDIEHRDITDDEFIRLREEIK